MKKTFVSFILYSTTADMSFRVAAITYSNVNQCTGLFDYVVGEREKLLQWHGHVFSSLGLAKTILQSTVKGGRRQGRQRKRWEDNIREWTGLELAK